MSEFLNQGPCVQAGSNLNGLCTDPLFTQQGSCIDGGATWENNTWTSSALDGYFSEGEVKGFQ